MANIQELQELYARLEQEQNEEEEEEQDEEIELEEGEYEDQNNDYVELNTSNQNCEQLSSEGENFDQKSQIQESNVYNYQNVDDNNISDNSVQNYNQTNEQSIEQEKELSITHNSQSNYKVNDLNIENKDQEMNQHSIEKEGQLIKNYNNQKYDNEGSIQNQNEINCIQNESQYIQEQVNSSQNSVQNDQGISDYVSSQNVYIQNIYQEKEFEQTCKEKQENQNEYIKNTQNSGQNEQNKQSLQEQLIKLQNEYQSLKEQEDDYQEDEYLDNDIEFVQNEQKQKIQNDDQYQAQVKQEQAPMSFRKPQLIVEIQDSPFDNQQYNNNNDFQVNQEISCLNDMTSTQVMEDLQKIQDNYEDKFQQNYQLQYQQHMINKNIQPQIQCQDSHDYDEQGLNTDQNSTINIDNAFDRIEQQINHVSRISQNQQINQTQKNKPVININQKTQQSSRLQKKTVSSRQKGLCSKQHSQMQSQRSSVQTKVYTKEEIEQMYERKHNEYVALQKRKSELINEHLQNEQKLLKPNFVASARSSQIVNRNNNNKKIGVQERSQQQLQRKQKWIEEQKELQLQKEEEEIQKFKFKPNLSSTKATNDQIKRDFYQYQESWQQDKINKISSQKILLAQKDLEGLTFKPQINQFSPIKSSKSNYSNPMSYQTLSSPQKFSSPQYQQDVDFNEQNSQQFSNKSDVYTRLYEKKKEYDEKKSIIEKSLQPSFKPIITPKSRQIIQKKQNEQAFQHLQYRGGNFQNISNSGILEEDSDQHIEVSHSLNNPTINKQQQKSIQMKPQIIKREIQVNDQVYRQKDHPNKKQVKKVQEKINPQVNNQISIQQSLENSMDINSETNQSFAEKLSEQKQTIQNQQNHIYSKRSSQPNHYN
ncbi:hypothetical protein PPERSA_08263 [Pseudocohnilembus persalinus]|uniref:Uncharacterized protein n=1 Tax=Pseudocohnilembus persalinus TaxID=266149 RepID=A0A0V0QGC0_PSEPJ|nr:hypothetical protein PPERSA_08263 [Pseudocohnilembus persalinus]|eukprot:KRX01162.1 hypothetical protein PPERSA_08263 [Pseudocohnilembus persalinus]